jgi:hypothetical protein
MKGVRLLAAALALTVCVQAAAAPPPTSYPLRVRGGRLYLRADATRVPSQVKLIVEFSPGTARAGAGLRPGQGAWLDRGMRAGEPNRLEYFMHADDARKIMTYLRRTDAYYTFECYNTQKGYLQVTKAYQKSVRID